MVTHSGSHSNQQKLNVKQFRENIKKQLEWISLIHVTLGAFLIFVLYDFPVHHKKDRTEAWNVLNSSLDQTGSGGRIDALQNLVQWQKNRNNNLSKLLDTVLLVDVADYFFGKPVDLKGVKANKAFLRGVELEQADLEYADFQESKLWEANLKNAKLNHVNFQRATLKDAELIDAELIGANLSSANLSGAKFNDDKKLSGANLSGANLSGAVLPIFVAQENAANLSRSIYSKDTKVLGLDGQELDEQQKDKYLREKKAHKIEPDANLSGKDLTNVNFSGVDLNRVDLSGANLNGADLRKAKNLRKATLTQSIYTENTQFPDSFDPKDAGAYLIKLGVNLSGKDLTNVNLSGLDLTGINLTDADLSRADLSRAELKNAILVNTTLIAANLSRANLSGAKLIDDKKQNPADLSGADLSGADLSSAEGLELATLTGIRYTKTTEIPKDFKMPEDAIYWIQSI